MTRRQKTRSIAAVAVLTGAFTVFSWRLIDLQVGKHGHYAKLAATKNTQRIPIYARRGAIVSANGEPLALNEPLKTIVANGTLITDFEAVAHVLSPHLGIPKAELLSKLKRKAFSGLYQREIPSQYIVLKKEVSEDLAQKLLAELGEKKLRGIHAEQDFRRRYPNGTLLSQVIGYVNSEGKGVAGIEQSMDKWLQGIDGYRCIEHDRTGKELVLYRGQEKEPENGKNVKLTIDTGLQRIVEHELNEAMKQFRPKFAVAIMQNPHTGEIMAMGTRPGFDPNDVPEFKPSQEKDPEFINPLINRAIAASYEPGSTFKIVATGAALSDGKVHASDYIYCENGYYKAFKLADHARYGSITVSDILVKSSNIGACKLAQQLGPGRFYEYILKFGFGARTGLILPGEEEGLLRPPHQWNALYSISRIPMGHEIAVTPIQSICSMSVVANGGKLLLPQIVSEVTDADGNIIERSTPQVVNNVLTPAAAKTVREALTGVTSERGTARLANVSGFKVAGKTGTAQVYVKGKISSERHRVSFVGFMPAENPAFTCLVMVEQPQTPPNQDMGGLVAAPIFARIAEQAAQYLGLEPDPAAKPIVASAQTSNSGRQRIR
jgi:cell division protein FtsI (penicillin-binding protein 3)/stage V sporulation protein D (sporulation-specific penicillin-binding protein)